MRSKPALRKHRRFPTKQQCSRSARHRSLPNRQRVSRQAIAESTGRNRGDSQLRPTPANVRVTEILKCYLSRRLRLRL
jgi:hypothetical protein